MRSQLLLFTILIPFLSVGQTQETITYTRPSQLAKVFQRIGTTDIEITYHAPLAKDRKIFGDLVQYDLEFNGKPQPWRAGANENTIITFGHDVMINGQPLKAGKYGLHIFVSEQEWELSFSNDHSGWGSFSYTEENDALRVMLSVQHVAHQDWLSYQFLNPRSNAVTVELHWADKQIQFEITTNVEENIIADVEKMENKNWAVLLAAAKSKYKLQPQAIDEVLELVDESLALEVQFSALMYKAELLEKKGETGAANTLKSKTIDTAEANELFSYAMHLNNIGEAAAALQILSLNLEKNPEHWMSYLGYGHYYRSKNDSKAIDFLNKALQFAPEKAKGFARYQLGFAKNKLQGK